MQIQSINKAHQSKVNKAVYWLSTYNNFNNLRDQADGNGDEKLYKALDKKCAHSFDKYLDYAYELPKREREKIEKSDLY
jgi:hypothetical protein